jgi:CheY-like chemotaxis protein
VRHQLKAGRHLLGLIDEVLNIARIEAGRLALAPESVPLEEVVAEALDLVRPLAEQRGVTLETAGEVSGGWVRADRRRLKQVVLNLLTNAVKYNREGGCATLSVSSEQRATSNEGGAVSAEPQAMSDQPGDEADPALLVARCSLLRLTVRDTGPGIPAERPARLFMPFDRLGAEGSGVEGTGLGLAIARRLVEAMGGAIGVESEPGQGSAFWVELARAADAGTRAASDVPAQWRPDGGLRAVAGTVLYIEDNEPNLEVIRQILTLRPGIALLAAADGGAGLELARERRPDLILLDLNLPDLLGDEVLRLLRRDARTHGIPVVMVSAAAGPGQIERVLADGARAYLTKPLEVRRLLALLDEILARQEIAP